MSAHQRKDPAFTTLDPLGEIQRRAKEIWIESGRPHGRRWEDFLREAEEDLLCSGVSVIHSDIQRNRQGMERAAAESEQFRKRVQTFNDPLANAIALRISKPLDEHEAYSLVELLLANRIRLHGTGELTVEETQLANVLAILGPLFPDETKLPSTEDQALYCSRCTSWRELIHKWVADDNALTFADRNTMRRLQKTLEGQIDIQNERWR